MCNNYADYIILQSKHTFNMHQTICLDCGENHSNFSDGLINAFTWCVIIFIIIIIVEYVIIMRLILKEPSNILFMLLLLFNDYP